MYFTAGYEMHPDKLRMEKQAKKYMDIFDIQCTGRKLFNFLKTQRKYYTEYKKKTSASGAAVDDKTILTDLQKNA